MTTTPQGEAVLLPCPFCGSSKLYVMAPTCNRSTPYNAADRAFPIVRCECGAEAPGKDWAARDTAIAAWNTRAALAPPNAAIPSAELMPLLASAWFYGNWKAETYNERAMQKIMEDAGWWPFADETALHAAIDRAAPPNVQSGDSGVREALTPEMIARLDESVKHGYPDCDCVVCDVVTAYRAAIEREEREKKA